MLQQVKSVLNSANLAEITKDKEVTKDKDQKKKDDPLDKRREEVEKAMDIYKSLDDVYQSNWNIPMYSMDPAFHWKVGQIKERLRATKTYRDDNYFIDPASWSWDKQIRQDVSDQNEAVVRAAEHFDLEAMKEHSKVVADAAQANSDLAPIAVAKNTTVDQMVADHQRKQAVDAYTAGVKAWYGQ